MNTLNHLEPAAVWRFFQELCAIPHGSGNTQKISDYCMEFARARNLSCTQDTHHNVVIRKPASPGLESRPPVILQAHLDMVCVKEKNSPQNFMTDPVPVVLDGEFVRADRTTLGADDGVGVSMALAILDDDALIHPSLEALFTTEEETGMEGANGMDASLLQGRALINLDSEEEGILTAGCAGGARVRLTLPLSTQPASGTALLFGIEGLTGGHSGMDINKGRESALVLASAVLNALYESFPFRLADWRCGAKDNAIPVESSALLVWEDESAAESGRQALRELFPAFARPREPGLRYSLQSSSLPLQAWSRQDTRRVLEFAAALPHGVQSMSEAVPGLVETSLNFGVLAASATALTATAAVRSAVNTRKRELLDCLRDLAARFSARYEESGVYPAWEYRQDSPLRRVMTDVYTSMFGALPKTDIIHAGLECGILSDKLPGLDAVSIGPDLFDVHTTKERASIPSVKRTYAYLCAVLSKL